MTQLEYARANTITPLMKEAASCEGVSPACIQRGIKNGTIVIPLNNHRCCKKPCAIGKGLRTKVNANIGTSTEKSSIAAELNKLKVAIHYGADTIMDLSVGAHIQKTRKKIIALSPVPVGTVPIYEIAVGAKETRGNFLKFGSGEMLETLEIQAQQGVDFFTIHAGVTIKAIETLKKKKRILGIVSRGGAILAAWISHQKKENPFYEHFDKILEIARAYDVTLSLGDGLRPGSILDATDPAQICELQTLGELALRAKKRGVQIMIEGPGHVPLQDIKKNIELEKRLCHQAPFYVLGPLVTDVGSGYDHITGAIGGALAASFGADFLCYVTPAEHLRHPTVLDVREGVIASKIAAHAADIAKGIKGCLAWDKEMSLVRKKRDWKAQIRLSVDPEKARSYRLSSKPRKSDVCTMCGNYCSIKLMEDCVRV